jgi:hypothetical protein
MSPTILEFPKHKIVREAPSPIIEELERLKEKGIQNFADGLTQEISSGILSDLSNYGIDIDSQPFIKDYMFLLSILSSTIYRSLDVEHPLHKFIDANISLMKEDEETTE